MSLPLQLNPTEATQDEYNRKAATAVNGLIRRTSGLGTTSQRPVAPITGQQYYDTTLGKPIWAHASGVWKDASGTTV